MNIDKLREHLYCEIELNEYDDGHFTVECISCNKILLKVYPRIPPHQIKERLLNDHKNYYLSRL